MRKLSGLRLASASFLITSATVIAGSAQVFTTLANFDLANGSGPSYMSLIQGTDGSFYGTTYEGGANCIGINQFGCGTIFKITRKGKVTTLYNFCGQPNCADGADPVAGLVFGSDGNFYGTTLAGGEIEGTVFRITPGGALTTLHTFTGTQDGGQPFFGLLRATDGNYYGTTTEGGPHGEGTVFKIDSAGSFSTIYDFCRDVNCSGGAGPLLQGTDADFYGVTGGGRTGDGRIFRVSLEGEAALVHVFNGEDGSSPNGPLTQSGDALFGTTLRGGAQNEGVLFKLSARGLERLHTFCRKDNCPDGAYPSAGLIQATDGNFYGVAQAGGDNANGTIFRITRDGKFTRLHSFAGYPTDGSAPTGGLLQGTDGKFYGTTSFGGSGGCEAGCGTVFSLDMGLQPFVAFIRDYGKVGQSGPILGQGFTGTTSVAINGIEASFTVVSDTYIRATVPQGASTGYVTVTTPSGVLTSNMPFHVLPQ